MTQTTPKKIHFSDLSKDDQKTVLALLGENKAEADEPFKQCWHGCLNEGVECTYPDCLSEEQ